MSSGDTIPNCLMSSGDRVPGTPYLTAWANSGKSGKELALRLMAIRQARLKPLALSVSGRKRMFNEKGVRNRTTAFLHQCARNGFLTLIRPQSSRACQCALLFTGAAGVAEKLYTASTAFKVACPNYGLAP